jgi:ABC-2 type transport system permease protein
MVFVNNFIDKWSYIINFYRKAELKYTLNNFIWSISSLGYIISILTVYYFNNKTAFEGFIGYNFVSYIIFIFTNSWVNLDISARIADGKLTTMLLTPTHFLTRYFAMFIGRNCLAYFIISIPAIILFSFFALPYLNFEITFLNFVITCVLLITSYIISFFLNTIAGFATFWTTRNDAVNEFYFVFRNLLRGDLVILTTVATVFNWIIFQPFAFIAHHPFMVLTNKYNFNQILWTIAGSLFWVFTLYLVTKLILKLGLKKYEGTGL